MLYVTIFPPNTVSRHNSPSQRDGLGRDDRRCADTVSWQRSLCRKALTFASPLAERLQRMMALMNHVFSCHDVHDGDMDCNYDIPQPSRRILISVRSNFRLFVCSPFLFLLLLGNIKTDLEATSLHVNGGVHVLYVSI